MKQYQICYTDSAGFKSKLEALKSECDAIAHGDITFYITWSQDVDRELEDTTKLLESIFPDAVYYGNEADGNISNGVLSYGINVTCYVFEGESTKTELVWVQEGTALGSMQDLWDYCKTKKELRAVELIPSISYLETMKIEGNVPDISDDILIFGGASVNYTLDTYLADIIASGHPKTKEGMAVMLYYGDDIQFSSTYVIGWKGLGNLMEVTKSHAKFIDQIDGNPAYSIYEKYLNLSAEDSDSLVFPLIVVEDGVEYIRTPQIIRPDKSMQMFVNIPEGSQVRIAYGDKNTILNTLYEKAKQISEFRPEGIKAFSCAGRKIFWGDAEISKETKILEGIAPVCGFYTGGEILKFGSKLRVLNQTLCIVSFKENESSEKKEPVSATDKSPDKSLVSRLAYFVAKVSEEQQIEHEKVLEQQAKVMENMEIIGGLASEYLALYFINFRENVFRIYSVDEGRLADTKRLLTESNDAFALIRKFAQSPAVHPDDRHLFESLTKENVIERLNGSKKFVIRFRRNYGSGYLWSVMDVLKYEAPNEEANAIAIGFAERDKEIRKDLESQRKLQEAYEAAEVANKSKTSFLFNMSHDIRTPMNAITGFTSMAKKNVENKDKVVDYLDKIDLSGQQLLKLINQVLEMARIESGKIEIEEKPINIKEKFDSIATILSGQARTNGQKFSYSICDVQHLNVFADDPRLSQITLNIAGNAMKYTPYGGQIDFCIKEIPARKEGYATYTITVADTGVGMSKEFQKVMFEPFSRESTTTVSKIQGTGLGMSIVKNIVELMGGNIDVQSEIDKGTTFSVTLDFRINENNVIKSENSASPLSFDIFKGRRALLVEDNELNREIAKFLLEDKGIIVEEADDGDVALEKVLAVAAKKDYYYYDFILMDVQMPRMNGFEATAKIRAVPSEGHRVPIIAMTANAFEEDRKNAIAAGMDEHLAKPINTAQLWATLAKFIKK